MLDSARIPYDWKPITSDTLISIGWEGQTMTQLSGDAIREIAGKVFGDRSMTLSEAGAGYELGELVGSVRALRRLMHATLEASPDSAFTRQPPADGGAAWSAGQVIAHLANSQASITDALRSLFDMPASPGGERHDLELLPSRDESLVILDVTIAGFDTFVAGLPTAATAKTMHHDRFGEMSGNGWMMLMVLHESGHLRQVRELAP